MENKETKGFYTPEIIAKFAAALRDAENEVKHGLDRITISKGNNKMGIFPSVSLLPFLTCPGCCGKTCGKYCYAAKLANLRPSVLKSYARNTAIANLKPEIYFEQVDAAAARSRNLRLHVSGDFKDPDYLRNSFKVFANNKRTNFLAFTKRFDWCNAQIADTGIPENLSLLYSGEKNLKPVNPFHVPETIVVEPGMIIQPEWKLCGGNCERCALHKKGCMGAKPGDIIAFKKH